MSRVLDRLKQAGVRTSSRKNFGVRAAFAGRMPYFTIIRPIVSLLTVHNINIIYTMYNLLPFHLCKRADNISFPSRGCNSAVLSLLTSLYMISQ